MSNLVSFKSPTDSVLTKTPLLEAVTETTAASSHKTNAAEVVEEFSGPLMPVSVYAEHYKFQVAPGLIPAFDPKNQNSNVAATSAYQMRHCVLNATPGNSSLFILIVL